MKHTAETPQAKGFYVDRTSALFENWRRVRTGIDRLETLTLCIHDGKWSASARAVDLTGREVCPTFEGPTRDTWREALGDLDRLPPEFAYHGPHARPGR